MPFQIFTAHGDVGYSLTLCSQRPGRCRRPAATRWSPRRARSPRHRRHGRGPSLPAPRPGHPRRRPRRGPSRARPRRPRRVDLRRRLPASRGGLLDGRVRRPTGCTPPSSRAASRVDVDPDVLFVDEGSVVTSAGVASGIDVCLHLLRTDRGAAVANRVARNILAPPHRDGGQAQFIAHPVEPDRPGVPHGDPHVGAAAARRAAHGHRPRPARVHVRAHVRPRVRRRDGHRHPAAVAGRRAAWTAPVSSSRPPTGGWTGSRRRQRSRLGDQPTHPPAPRRGVSPSEYRRTFARA